MDLVIFTQSSKVIALPGWWLPSGKVHAGAVEWGLPDTKEHVGR